MSSVHLFTDDDDEFQTRWIAGRKSCEVQVSEHMFLVLRRAHAEKLHAVLGDALAQLDEDGES